MRTLRHPFITPAVEVEVEDDRVPAYLATGWLLTDLPEPVEPSTTPDPQPTGEDHNSEENA